MATREYDRENTTRINLKLNNKTDQDIIEKLAQVDNVQGFIKAVIRNEMEGVQEMKKFERVTNEIYGARIAGYVIDRTAEREVNTQLMRKLTAERGERFVENKLDELYDYDGDLFMDPEGETFAVCYVDGVPLCWQHLRKAAYHVKPEFFDLWGEETNETTIIDGDQVAEFAREWERPVMDLFEQLELIPED